MFNRQFIQFSIAIGAIWMSAELTRELKSKRKSPYFFNSGDFSTGATVSQLAQAYAQALHNASIGFDVLFGPACKGTLLVPAVAMSVFITSGQDVGFASNRKETKDHGEGGDLIGSSLDGKRVIIVDDVITKGGAKREAFDFVVAHGGTPVGIVVAFDRQERGESDLSASQEVTRDLGIPVIAAATTSDLINYLTREGSHPEELAAIRRYYAEYGVKN